MSRPPAIPPMARAKPGLFYGYIVVLAGFMVMFIAYGSQYSFGVFFKPVLAEFGWTRAVTSGAYSLFMVLYGFFAIFAGRLNDKFGPRMVVTVCGLFAGSGYLLMSKINTAWQLYLFYGVLIAIGMSATTVPLLSTVARWFVRKRGLMTGITVSGAPLGTTIMPPIVSLLISSYGWRISFLIVGMVILVLMIVAAQFMRRDPHEVGQLPDGESITPETGFSSEAEGFSLREAVLNRQFWIACFAWVCAGFFVQATMVHIVPYATDLGISAVAASGLLSLSGGLGVVGRVVMGNAGDRLGNKATLIISFIIMLISFILLLVGRELWLLYLFAGIFGFAISSFLVLGSPLVAELFGLRAHGTILGVITFAWSFGGALGPIVTGYIFDVTGRYHLAFVLWVLLSAIGLIAASLIRPVHQEV